jgi:hypothetical protein
VSFCTDVQVTPFSFVIIEGETKIVENSRLLKWGAKIEQRYAGNKVSEENTERVPPEGSILVEITPSKIIGTKNITG